MRLFRKKQIDKRDAPKIVGSEIIHKVLKEWSDRLASYHYVLYRAEQNIWSDGSKKINPYYAHSIAWSYNGWIRVADGNLSWANRQAKHYKIGVPT